MYSGRNVLKGYRINIGTPYQIEVKPKEEAAAKTEEDTAAAEEKPLVDEILQNARMEAEKIVNNAKIKAEEILNSANEKVAAIVSEAEEKARQEGYKQGEALARQHYQRLIDEAEEIKRKAKEIHDSTILGMESEIVELIIQITKKIIGTELSQNRDVIVGLIRNAVSAASLADTVLIHVSDEDYDYVVENKDRLFEGIKGVENFEIIKDNSLKKGECFVDTGMGIVDSSIETQIDAAESTLRDLLGGTDEKK